MKKNTFLFYTIVVVFLLLHSSIYAGRHTENTLKNNTIWLDRSFAPELDLQPYFEFFTATCITYSPPFVEGFNYNSKSFDCWTIVDNNDDGNGMSNIWQTYDYDLYEGDRSVLFYGDPVSDDWLISPAIKLDATKIYRLKYFYKTSSAAPCDFDVLLSTSGIKLTDFTKVLRSKKADGNNVWEEETIFISNVGGNVNIAWHVSSMMMFLDQVTVEEVANCPEPLKLTVKDIEKTKATIGWSDDANNSGWEYVVQPSHAGVPTAKGVSTTTKQVIVDQDHLGNKLLPSKEYEFYVRAQCANKSNSDWSGPYVFFTACDVVALPFTEGFNTGSPTVNCWKVVDNNGDGMVTPFVNLNYWSLSPNDSYEGDQSMFFYGYDEANTNQHDDWLISPTFDMDGGVYVLKYHYKADNYNNNKFELLLSDSGTELNKFTTVLLGSQLYQNSNYKEEIIYIKGITAEVNIAWHVTSVGSTSFNVDNISLTKVDCVDPINITAKRVKENEATLSWTDSFNSEWEYAVREVGQAGPLTSGTLTTVKEVVVKNDDSGKPLQAETDYEFFVRARCKNGTVFSEWTGPFDFQTACKVFTVPFKEGFNSGTESHGPCWRIIDVALDQDFTYGGNIWTLDGFEPQEGDKNAFFRGYSNINHDDWLVSPAIRFTGGMYAISYYYKTGLYSSIVDFEVLLSKNGISVDDFTTVLQVEKNVNTFGKYVKKTVYVQGVTADVNVAWRVKSNQKTELQFHLDNILVEEIQCIPPDDNIVVSDVKENSVTLTWTDDVNSRWEYYVSDGSALVGSGTLSNTKSVNITKDTKGNNLLPDTEYYFYVRSNCGAGKYSKWVGPISVKTLCKEFTVPFKEGFNTNSPSLNCWRRVDVANDGLRWLLPPRDVNWWGTYIYDRYEGDQVATFFGEDRKHDDWYISPTIKLEGKKYALTYYFKTGSSSGPVGFGSRREIQNTEYEILMSTKGIDVKNFSQVVLAKKTYREQEYVRKTVYIENVTGSVNLAWHINQQGNAILFLDNITIEEVDCVPPKEDLEILNIKKDEVKVSWASIPDGWEYVVQPAWGAIPTSNGVAVKTKEVDIKTLNNGQALAPNTEYEIYVRSNCSTTSKSLWVGPYRFRTPCGVFQVPFWEGFNSDYWKYKSETLDCWRVVDKNKDGVSWGVYRYGPYEGDQEMYFIANDRENKVNHDDWLISPTIEMDGGNYVIKYHYKADSFYNNELEVLLSKDGIATDKFTTVVVAKKSNKIDKYIEEIAYVNGIKGEVNIAWHLVGSGSAGLQLDNIFIEKASPCPEPTAVKVTKQTTNGFDLQWKQSGNVTEWEVIVIEAGEDLANHTGSAKVVKGQPATTISGLKAGMYYEVYVRALCGPNDASSWTNPLRTATRIEANDECRGALTVPVNTGLDCEKVLSATFLGATLSATPLPSCWVFTNEYGSDAWFEFTATSPMHMLSISNIFSESTHITYPVEIAVYEVDCNSINTTTVPLCSSIQNGFYPYTVMDDLIVGKKYYLRLGIPKRNSDIVFTICITTPASGIEVVPNDNVNTVAQTVSEVLMQSDCDLVSNVTHKFGDDTSVQAMGSFKKNNSIFPFDAGIVLTTHDVTNATGPRSLMNQSRNKVKSGVGDVEMNKILEQMGSDRAASRKQTSVLEFDFTPVQDTIQFDYLFASDVYHSACSYQCREGGGLMAILITDLTTGQTQNVTLIPGTSQPISTSTIRKVGNFEISCQSANPEYFWKNYYYDIDNPLEAPVNYVGLAVPMKSIPYRAEPGRKYHIKIGVLDLCDDQQHGTAVFVKSAVFGAPKIDLGDDKLIADQTAFCGGERFLIKSGVEYIETYKELNYKIEWYKDNVLIPGAVKPDLEVTTTGEYKILVRYLDVQCESSDTIKIEFYPPISTVVKAAADLEICRNSLGSLKVDLTQIEASMLSNVDRSNYKFTYYQTKEAAELKAGAIPAPQAHEVIINGADVKIYIVIEDLTTGCTEIFEWTLRSTKGAVPESRENVQVCAPYTFPDLAPNQYYYTATAGAGKSYQAGDQLQLPGVYTFFVLQDNGGGCYEEISYRVEVIETVRADVFKDEVLDCEMYVLKPLSAHNGYFTQSGGLGTELAVGSFVTHEQTIYVYASAGGGLCADESSFKISFNECPIQKGISPNGDGLNDTFELTQHGVSSIVIYNRYGSEVFAFKGAYTDQWHGQDKGGKQLPDGTYYYVVIARGKARTGWVQINR